MSLIVLYFLHSTSVLSFYIDIVLTLTITAYSFLYQNHIWTPMSAVPPKYIKLNQPLTHLYQNPTTWTRFATLQSVDILILRCQCQVCTILYAFQSNQVQGVKVNTLRLRQNGHHFSEDTFKCIFLNENIWILLNISLKFVPKANWQHSSIGSNNGLASSRRQAIVWTNYG